MESYLPSKSELEQLYYEKGGKALVWYAWRNILRTLPMLGSLPLEEIWKKETKEHIYNICRIYIIFASIPVSEKVCTLEDINKADDAARASDSRARLARATVDLAKVYITESIAYSIAYEDARVDSGVVNADDDAYAAAAYTTAQVAYDAVRVAVSATRALRKVSDIATFAARVDYNFVFYTKKLPEDIWFSRPLWQKKYYKDMTEPNELVLLREVFITNLRVIGLKFLSNDLKFLLLMQGKPQAIPKHWNNYIKEFSAVELNDSEALQALILGESEEINAVRILLVGPGGAGKSTLADRLFDNGIEIVKKSTKGIDYLDNKALVLDGKKGAFSGLKIPENLELYCWDFGGQTLFYGLHKSFMHENCVYVLVVDSRHEQAPDEWLQQIRHLSEGKQTSVLLVSNEYEGCNNQQNESRLRREFGEHLELHFHYFACNNPDDSGLLDFKRNLLNTASASRHYVSKKLLETGNELEQCFNHRPVISYTKLVKTLKQQHLLGDDKSEAEKLIVKLKGLGRLVAIDKDDKRLCLDPIWVIDHAYKLLFFDCLIESKGLVSSADLQNEAEEAEQSSLETGLQDLIRFLQSSRICVPMANQDKLFFPDLASYEEPDELPSKVECLSVELHFPYLPIGLFARLVSFWMQKSPVGINDYKEVWREGFILRHKKDSETGIWLEYHSRKAIILLNCFGDSKLIADMLVRFWEGLTESSDLIISPIQAGDILPLLPINSDYFARVKDSTEHLQKASRWLKNPNEILKAIQKMEETSKVSKTEIHNHGVKQVNVSTGKKATQTNTYNDNTQQLTVEERTKLGQALNELQKSYDLTPVQRKDIGELQVQVEADEIEPEKYGKLISGLNLTGSAASIAGLIWTALSATLT